MTAALKGVEDSIRFGHLAVCLAMLINGVQNLQMLLSKSACNLASADASSLCTRGLTSW